MSDDKTVTKTLWSETLIDVFVVALKKDSPDDQIREILKELQQKGFKMEYIIDKITRELNAASARRIRSLAIK